MKMKNKIMKIAIALIFALSSTVESYLYRDVSSAFIGIGDLGLPGLWAKGRTLRPPASRMNILEPTEDDSQKSVLAIAQEQLIHMSKILGISRNAMDIILEPENIFRFTTIAMLDDDKTYHSEFIRVRQSTVSGPAKGGIRYVTKVNPAEAQGLAFLMLIKNAGMRLPLGGGKGEAQIDIEKLNLNEIARVTKESIWQAMKQYDAFGEEIDIPAPDQRTGQTIMAYMTDAILAWHLSAGTLKNKDAQKILLNIPEVKKTLEYYQDDHKRIRKKPISDTENIILQEVIRLVKEEGYVISEIASFTGKPLDRGGVCVREEATGLGGFFTETAVLEHYAQSSGIFKGNETVKGLTHVLRGSGNVGMEYAKICSSNGGKFNAIANAISAIKYTGSDGKGIDINELVRFIERKRHDIFMRKVDEVPDISKKAKSDLWELIQKIDIDLTEHDQEGVVPVEAGEDIIDVKADILVEAATHCTIHAKNAHRVNQKMILELANAPTTRQADIILAKKGIIIIPDVLANAGGVIVSMYEAKQNMTGVDWPIELTHARLEERVRRGVEKMFNVAKDHPFEKFSNRDAHWMLSLKSVIDAIEARMWRRQDERLSTFSASIGSFLKGIKTDITTDDQLWRLYASGELAMQRAIDEESAFISSRLLHMVEKISTNMNKQDPEKLHVRLCLIGGPTSYKLQTIKQMIDILERNYGTRAVYLDLDFLENAEKLKLLLNGEDVQGIHLLDSGNIVDAGKIQLEPGDIIFAEGSYAIANETLDMLSEMIPRITIATDICPSTKVTVKGGRQLMITNDDYTMLREMLVSRYMRVGDLTSYISLINAVRHRQQAISKIYTTFHNRADVIYNTFNPFELIFIRNLALPILEGAIRSSQLIIDDGSKDLQTRTEARNVRRVARHLIRILLALPDIDIAEMQLEVPPTIGFRQILPANLYTKRPSPALPNELKAGDWVWQSILKGTPHVSDTTSQSVFYSYPWTETTLRVSKDTYWSNTRTKRIIQHIEKEKIDLKGKRIFVPGAGSGILPIYAALKGAYVVASEIQHISCEDMRFNIKQAGLENKIEVREGPYLTTLKDSDRFDIVLCHPPIFKKYYRRQSMNTHDQNFGFITSFIKHIPARLNPEGLIILLYTSSKSAINLTLPEEDIYLFNLESIRGKIETKGFQLTDLYPRDTENESTIWQITHANKVATPRWSADFPAVEALIDTAA